MAALKKTLKKKDTTKPGTVLIIFLVLFILTSIGLGVAMYYGYEGQEKLRQAAKDAKSGETARKLERDYRITQAYMLGAALGQDLEDVDKELGAGELENISNEGGKFGKEKDRPAFAKLFEEMKKDLIYDAAGKKFATNYRAKYKQTLDEKNKAENDLATTQKALKDEQKKFIDYETKVKDFYNNALAQIAKNKDTILTDVNKRSESFMTLLKLNKEIQDQKLELEGKLKETQDKLEIELARVNKILEEAKKQGPGEVIHAKKENGERHALMLDLSRGIPLWDRPVGKVTRVDAERRQIFINIGSDLGVRPDLTFLIFADDGKGNADKFLKGTAEVVRVIDGQTSLCRITSLYDTNGVEVALNDQARNRTVREVEANLREGDLLFNMFWNSHVAIAGSINFTGYPIDAPSEQMRHLTNLVQMLNRTGIHVDGYLDLTDLQFKGALTPKTRFLILGDRAEPKDTTNAEQVERAKQINDAIAAVKKDAVEKGMFVISAENFSIAAGYRRPRGANDSSVSGFRATAPFAGISGAAGLVIQRERPGEGAAAPMPKKDAPEPKEKEAKEKDSK